MADMVAVIPTFVLFGPIALLAALFPVVFGGLSLWLRRWVVLFGVASLVSLLYFVHGAVRPYLAQSWVGRPIVLQVCLAVIAASGAFWSFRRQRVLSGSSAPTRIERRLICGLAVLAAGVIAYGGWHHLLSRPPWCELTILACVTWAGGLWLLTEPLWKGRGSYTESAMLLGLACGCLLVAWPTPQLAVGVLWTYEYGAPGVFSSSPRLAEGRLYLAGGYLRGQQRFGVLHSLDATTGRTLLDFSAEGRMKPVFSSPCIAGDRLFIGEGLHQDSDCHLFCLDRRNGGLLWSFPTKSHVESSPIVYEDRVFFGAGEDGVYCVNAETGKEVWHFRGLHVDGSPALEGGRVFVGSGYGSHEVFALDAATGKRLWQTRVDLPAFASPLSVGDRVYFGLGTGNLTDSGSRPAGAMLCCSAEDGRVLWRETFPDAVHGRPVVLGDQLCFGCRDGSVYCLDRNTGKHVWQQVLGSPVVTTPALRDSRLYVAATGGQVCRLNISTGAIEWNFDVGKHSSMKPMLTSSPWVVAGQDERGPFRRIYFGATLSTIVTSSAVGYCLEERANSDPSPELPAVQNHK